TQLFHRSAHRFRKRNVDLVFQIRSGLFFSCCLRGILAAATLAEQIAETCPASRACSPASAAKIESPEIEVNIFGRSAAIASPGRGPASLPRHIESELVLHLPLLGVRQYLVRFLDLLEFFFRGFVAGIQI